MGGFGREISRLPRDISQMALLFAVLRLTNL